jgi:peroxiredoxin
LNTGDRLPAFALENAQGTVVRSDALLAKGPMVVTVFRGVW